MNELVQSNFQFQNKHIDLGGSTINWLRQFNLLSLFYTIALGKGMHPFFPVDMGK